MVGHKVCSYGGVWLDIPKIMLVTPSYLEHCMMFLFLCGLFPVMMTAGCGLPLCSSVRFPLLIQRTSVYFKKSMTDCQVSKGNALVFFLDFDI